MGICYRDECEFEQNALKSRIAELEAFAEWVKRHATEQAKAHREAGLDDLAWCQVVDQADFVTKSTV